MQTVSHLGGESFCGELLEKFSLWGAGPASTEPREEWAEWRNIRIKRILKSQSRCEEFHEVPLFTCSLWKLLLKFVKESWAEFETIAAEVPLAVPQSSRLCGETVRIILTPTIFRNTSGRKEKKITIITETTIINALTQILKSFHFTKRHWEQQKQRTSACFILQRWKNSNTWSKQCF